MGYQWEQMKLQVSKSDSEVKILVHTSLYLPMERAWKSRYRQWAMRNSSSCTMRKLVLTVTWPSWARAQWQVKNKSNCHESKQEISRVWRLTLEIPTLEASVAPGYSCLHSDFKASQGYRRLLCKNQSNKQMNKQTCQNKSETSLSWPLIPKDGLFFLKP